MGNRLNRYYEKQIITEKSLLAVQFLSSILKHNVRNRDLFRVINRDAQTEHIVNELEKGNLPGLANAMEQGLLMQASSALLLFLLKLKKPLIPRHIQLLALDENPGVSAEVIAQDILGLLMEDVSGRHKCLLMEILDLLHWILKRSPSDELRGCNVPITMMPVFFNLQSHHIPQWRRVAMIFVEIIRHAPRYFNIQSDSEGTLAALDNFETEDIPERHRQMMGIIEANIAMGQHLIRAGI